ncbi:MAG: putative DNA binding domain-containing protein [Candidatus Aenigmarchaeota archaeon]|nr:putative DNA binding domain-containing protein [Candidatus Aenigmarchaeota archaeon]
MDKIENLIKDFENKDIEFKTELPDSKTVAQLVCAFYNSRGGKIILGVDDDRNPIGLKNPQKQEHKFIQIIRHWCKLDKDPELKFVKYKEKDFIVIDCPKGKDSPYFVKGEYAPRVRIGSSNMPANKEEIARLYREGSSKSHDIYPVENATLDDLDLEKIKAYFVESELTEQLDEKHFFELMEKEGLIILDGAKKENIPTYAGILLFGKHTQLNIHCAVIKADRYRGINMIQWIDKNNFEGNIFELVEKCEYFFKKNMRVAAWSSGFKTEHKSEYPVEALKEAVINALAHRDYYQCGKDVLIRMFDNRIEVISPGELLRPLTIEKLLRHDYKPHSRNKVITRVLLRKEIMDERGSGILRMEKSMKKWGLVNPCYAEKDGYFIITFKGPGRAEKPLEEDILKGLNNRQRESIEYIRKEGSITNKTFREIFSVTDRTALRDLDNLVDKNILKRLGKRRAARYELR